VPVPRALGFMIYRLSWRTKPDVHIYTRCKVKWLEMPVGTAPDYYERSFLAGGQFRPNAALEKRRFRYCGEAAHENDALALFCVCEVELTG